MTSALALEGHAALRLQVKANTTIVLAMTAALMASACTTPRASVPAASFVAGAIKVAASEYKFGPSTSSAKAGDVTFEVTNSGTVDHEFEIEQDGKTVDEVEGLTPGTTRQLTVTLAAGQYTSICKLGGHDQLGMKGTLTVTD